MGLKEDVLNLPIEQVISSYIPLKKEGSGLVGLCPFHPDTHPSLKVNPEKAMFKCFSCGAGGDSISFVMEYLKIPFRDALEKIARDHGIETLTSGSHSTALQFLLLDLVMKAYVEEGKKHSILADYLKSRGVSLQTAEAFKLGIAPEKDIILDLIRKDDRFTADMALELGLIRKTAEGYADFFRNRFMFPIIREDGKCVGFSGRAINGETVPRYMNSKESPIFQKGNLLYGLHLNKDVIKAQGKVLVVEGFMDVISLYENDIRIAVGTMGTQLTTTNIQKLQSLARKFILGFDSDFAGQVACNKTHQKFLDAKIVVRSISYHPHKDANEFLYPGEKAAVELWARIEKSIPVIDKNCLTYVSGQMDRTLEEKIEAMKAVFDELKPLKLSLEATERVIHYGRMLGFLSHEDLLIQNYREYLQSQDLL